MGNTRPVQTRASCPNCGETLRFRDRSNPVCAACDTPVHISWSYRRNTAYTSALCVLLIALATFSSSSGGVWLLGLILFWPLIIVVLWTILPASYERGYDQPRYTFVAAFLTVFVQLFTIEFVAFGIAYILLGAKSSEIQELLFDLSIPLVWFSSQFLLTTNRSFVEACGVMMGNSLLLAIPLFGCVKIVQAAFRRNRVTQIGIGGVTDDSDD